MAFKKAPEIIAALKTPGEKQPELMRAMHGLPDRPDPPDSAVRAVLAPEPTQITEGSRPSPGDRVDGVDSAA